MASNVSTKADIKDLEKALGILYKKADLDSVHEQFSIQRKQTNESISEKFSDVKGLLKKTEENFGDKIQVSEDYGRNLEIQIKEAKNVLKLLETEVKSSNKDIVSNFSYELQQARSEFNRELGKIQKNYEDLKNEKAGKDEYKDTFTKLVQKLSAKADISDFEKGLNKSQKELMSSFQTIRDDYKIYFTKLENQMSAKYDQLITRNELREALSEKADNSQISRLLSSKMNLEELVKLRSETESALADMRGKALKSDLESHIASTKIAIEELSKELLSKAYIKDICTLLDTKASIEDVNSALTDIHKELDTKISNQSNNLQ